MAELTHSAVIPGQIARQEPAGPLAVRRPASTAADDLTVSSLAGAGAGWQVIHDVPMGSRSAYLPHVVVGPGGVFTILTMTHPDSSVWVVGSTIKVNGDSEHCLPQARRDAQFVAETLSSACRAPVPTQAVIAMVCPADRFTVRRQPHDVTVVLHRRLGSFLADQPTRLMPTERAAVMATGRRPATWLTS